MKESNNLDQDQTGHFVGPYLGPNCLQRLSAVLLAGRITQYVLTAWVKVFRIIAKFRILRKVNLKMLKYGSDLY